MVKPQMLPFAAGFDQLGYVTTDLDRACEVFAEHYGVPRFFKDRRQLNAIVRGQKGQIELYAGFADIGGVQIELLQPVSGLVDIYAEPLPRDGSFGLLFHHMRFLVSGTLEDWERNRAEIDQTTRPIVLDGGREGARYVYIDDRPRLGHYVEYVWFTPETAARRKAVTPQYDGKR